MCLAGDDGLHCKRRENASAWPCDRSSFEARVQALGERVCLAGRRLEELGLVDSAKPASSSSPMYSCSSHRVLTSLAYSLLT